MITTVHIEHYNPAQETHTIDWYEIEGESFGLRQQDDGSTAILDFEGYPMAEDNPVTMFAREEIDAHNPICEGENGRACGRADCGDCTAPVEVAQ
jgi:hypothetical protein